MVKDGWREDTSEKENCFIDDLDQVMGLLWTCQAQENWYLLQSSILKFHEFNSYLLSQNCLDLNACMVFMVLYICTLWNCLYFSCGFTYTVNLHTHAHTYIIDIYFFRYELFFPFFSGKYHPSMSQSSTSFRWFFSCSSHPGTLA